MSSATRVDGPIAVSVVRDAAGGDRVAFARLVDRYHEQMLRVTYAIAADGDMARDAVQNAWAIAWRRLATIRDPSQVGAWLVAIAANEARQALRRQRRRPVVQLSLAEPVDEVPGPASRIEVVDLQRALQHLGPDDRTLLALRFVAGLDSEAIAANLGLSSSGVRSRLARLLARLRKELDRA